MNAASLTWDWATCVDSHNAISSPEEESGVTPCDSPAGPMTDLFGQEVVPVPASQRQAKAEGLQTLVISGLIGSDSSASAALQTSLESRLMQRLDTAGSTLFKLTWRRRITPLGRRYLERAASVRRTSGSDCTSVPSPTAVENGGDLSKKAERRTRAKEKWGNKTGNGFGYSTAEVAQQFSGVPTPQAHDSQGPKTEAQQEAMRAKGHGVANLNEAMMFVGVPTPRAETLGTRPNMKGGATLTDMARMMGVRTPQASDADHGGPNQRDSSGAPSLTMLAHSMASGETPSGSPAATASIGQLNPSYSRYLMGLPPEWDLACIQAARKVKKERRRK